eukprot:545451_1
MLLLVSLLLALEVVQGLFYGPYFFPTGDTSDPIYINFGEHNTTHAFFNMFVTGDYWFGFGFASGSGCTAESALVNECYMKDTEALVFGDYASADPTKRFTAKEYILGTTAYPHSPEQEIAQSYLVVDEVTQHCFGGTCEYTVRIKRPYEPSGDRSAYKITYPMAGWFCFLWAQGDGISFRPSSSHLKKGSKCVHLGFNGTTWEPTASPTFGPTDMTNVPSHNPTLGPTDSSDAPSGGPSQQPSVNPSYPSHSPSNPTFGPTDMTNVPSHNPTLGPTDSSDAPSGGPSQQPSVNPSYPSHSPSNPTFGPTDMTSVPSHNPSVNPSDPSHAPSNPTLEPTDSSNAPSGGPSQQPSNAPYPTTTTGNQSIESTDAAVISLPDKRDVWLTIEVVGAVASAAAVLVLVLVLIKKTNQKQDENVITNALVALVVIGEYDHSIVDDDADVEQPLNDLPLEQDVRHLTELFGMLNYKIIPSNGDIKLHWKADEVISFLQNDVGKELFDAKDELNYDGLVVVISSHGIKDNIITSDYKTIEKDALHRLVSIKYPKARDIPRLFLFDSCEGSGERIKDELKEGNDQVKGFVLGDVPRGNEHKWTTSTKNPDYKLVEIHAANAGFQAKAHTQFGSYLIYLFAKKMKSNIERNEYKTLSLLFDEIQNELHDAGKSQTKNVFNNTTGELKFRVYFGMDKKRAGGIIKINIVYPSSSFVTCSSFNLLLKFKK